VVAQGGLSVAELTVILRDASPGASGGQFSNFYKLGSVGTFQFCRFLTRGKTITAEVPQQGVRIGSATRALDGGVVVFPILVTLRSF